jgi:hypothetical protein
MKTPDKRSPLRRMLDASAARHRAVESFNKEALNERRLELIERLRAIRYEIEEWPNLVGGTPINRRAGVKISDAIALLAESGPPALPSSSPRRLDDEH